MPTFSVYIETDNSAFEPEPGPELVRLLRKIADRIALEGLSGFYETILDTNGNDVGRFALKGEQGQRLESDWRPAYRAS